MFGKSEQRLDPQFHSRAAFRAIIDGVVTASGRHEVGGSQAINLLLGIPADETSQHSRKCSRVDRRQAPFSGQQRRKRSEEHTSELQSLMRISYAVFCLKQKQ